MFSTQSLEDSIIAKKYLDWLKAKYPNETIGLIWDYAGSHVTEQVKSHAAQLGIVLEYINKGMTSVQQPCDLLANQQKIMVEKKVQIHNRGSGCWGGE